MSFEVYKDIPVPETVREGFRRPSRYPFSTMLVGEMFFVPNAKKSFTALVSATGKRLGKKYVTRTVTLNGETGIACWRTE
jgi:hypothetical protein